MNLAEIVNVIGVLTILGGMAYGYGVLNSTVQSLKQDFADIKKDLYDRVVRCEKDIREIMTRCMERRHVEKEND